MTLKSHKSFILRATQTLFLLITAIHYPAAFSQEPSEATDTKMPTSTKSIEPTYNDSKAILSTKSFSGAQVNFAGEYYNMKAGKTSLRGLGFNLNAIYGFSPKWALGCSFNQAYSPKDNFAATNLAIEVRMGFALLGSYRTESLEHQQESWTVATIHREPQFRLEIGPHITQFFLNTKSGALPFSGFGLDLIGDYPLFDSFHATGGLIFDRLNNGNVLFTRTRVMFGIGVTL